MSLSDAFPQDFDWSKGYNAISVTSAEGWRDFGLCVAGAAVSWLVSPVTWLVLWPGVLVAFLAGLARTESRFDAGCVGDDGASLGIVQFNINNEVVGPLITPVNAATPSDPRLSAFWSGWYAVKNVQRALLTSPSWWAIGIPWLGYGVLRLLWVHGPERGLTRPEGLLSAAWSVMTDPSERDAPGVTAFLVWRAIGLALLVAGAAVAVASGLLPVAELRKRMKRSRRGRR